MISNSWQMDPRLGLPPWEAVPDLFSPNLKKKRDEKQGELGETGDEDERAIASLSETISKVSIWVGWDPSSCLSISNKTPNSYTGTRQLEGKIAFSNNPHLPVLTFYFLACFGGILPQAITHNEAVSRSAVSYSLVVEEIPTPAPSTS